MKRYVLMVLLSILLVSLIGCSTKNAEPTLSPVEIARNGVIEKWTTAEGELGTARFIEDIYKEYPDDDVISNIYFYCIFCFVNYWNDNKNSVHNRSCTLRYWFTYCYWRIFCHRSSNSDYICSLWVAILRNW